MQATFTPDRVDAIADVSEPLERGRIVSYPRCPLDLPDETDLDFFRRELPKLLERKNVSYHPEADRVVGIEAGDDVVERVRRVLVEHSRRVEAFLAQAIPSLVEGWTVGTSSFRPLQERGRNLSPHASNELVHVDAGAYGATNGDRILRFFVNVHPDEDRVWATKGIFPDLYRRYGRAAGIVPARRPARYLEKGPLDHLRTGAVRGLASIGLPLARVLDSSPYDRVMRRFHNYMKDTAEFRDSRETHQEIRFPPFCAWMVLTDMVSHACVSGQHALVNTFLIRLKSCRLPELAPINVLKRG